MREIGYADWRNFRSVIQRAKNILSSGTCQGVIKDCTSHVIIGSGGRREIPDFELDRAAVNLVLSLAGIMKPCCSSPVRNKTVVLSLVKDYCEKSGLDFVFQYAIEPYYFDACVDNKVLIEFDEPHHGTKRQKAVDFKKDQLAVSLGKKVLHFGMSSTIIDIIVGIQKHQIKRARIMVCAIKDTLRENRHLADGDNCTLKLLKDAIGQS